MLSVPHKFTQRARSLAARTADRLAPALGTADRARGVALRTAERFGSGHESEARPAVTANTPPGVVRNGIVEEFSRRRVTGWITVAADAPAVKITLRLGNVDVATTWATGISDLIDRTSSAQARSFRFWLADIWRYTGDGSRLTVWAGERMLPIAGIGMFRAVKNTGMSSAAELAQKLQQGFVFDQYGKLQLSKGLDVEWQRQVLDLFADMRAFVHDRLGYDLFFIYGTLLGAVREHDFIGHDIDLDSAYVSKHADGQAAARELRDLAFALIDAGYQVEGFMTHLHVTNSAGARIDIFHTFFNSAGQMRFPFGIAGTSTLRRSSWTGVHEIDFGVGTGVVPDNAERFVAHLYGEDWRQPKPGFHWPVDRTDRAPGGIMTRAMNEEIYWANFYAHVTYDSGSTFQAVVAAHPDTPRTLVDIGCGDGRDSFAFGRAGFQALGLDRSQVGVKHAAKHASELQLADKVSFRAIDVSDVGALRTILQDVVAGSPQAPVLFYMRFFLHSITEDVQQGLLQVISDVSRPGDVLAAEFRTDKDEKLAKVHGGHFRRYQNAAEFHTSLVDQYYFQELLLEDQGTGLSPYRDEDPELYRVIARRSS